VVQLGGHIRQERKALKPNSPSWDDMSDFVVHFTRGGNDDGDYNAMMSIYDRCVLVPGNTFGIGRQKCPDPSSQQAVCFSEIPPGQWQRLVERRKTKYGIAFTKQYVVSCGGGPIWYVWKDTPHWQVLQDLMRQAEADATAPIWKLTPFIDSPGDYPSGSYFFEWEREWRHVGHLCFKPKDVAFLLIPERLHDAARSFFKDVQSEDRGPAYLCPYVDPTWDRNRILRAIWSQ
jgi:hypothetical protein